MTTSASSSATEARFFADSRDEASRQRNGSRSSEASTDRAIARSFGVWKRSQSLAWTKARTRSRNSATGGRAEFDAGREAPVFERDADGFQSGPEQLETFAVPRRQLALTEHEAEPLQVLDPTIARGDWDPEPAAQLDRGYRARRGPQEDSRGILVHDGLAHLKRLHRSVPLQRQDAIDQARDLIGLERLVEIPDGAAAHALDLGEGVAEGRHQDRPQPGSRPPCGLDQLDPVRAGHPVVRQEEVDALADEALQRFRGARRCDHAVSDDGEEFGQVLAHALIVVDDEDGPGDRLWLGRQRNHHPSRPERWRPAVIYGPVERG